MKKNNIEDFLRKEDNLKDSKGRVAPHVTKSVLKMIKIFGEYILFSEKQCFTCRKYKKKFRFGFRKNRKGQDIILGNCRDCESIRTGSYLK